MASKLEMPSFAMGRFMDQGAHFFRCDFQVHTPRDTNWAGKAAASDEERNAYAEDFIAACRKKGLDAVAITDHHDLCFFPYIKAAARSELDDEGQPMPPERQIVVFPGMELTLGVPCQAIIILDSDFPIDLLTTVYTVLACPHQDHTTAKHAPTQRLDDIKDFGNLCDMLDRIDHLKGHYIVLPNVTEGSNSSVVRKGFQAAYKSMPCVGGYVDGSMQGYGDGIQTIIAGKNKEWGFKSIGVIQTSDNRQADFAKLGQYSSWIKWATPTAEALRQACLAKETRISNEAPRLPTIKIDRLDVSNSRFLGPLTVDFNPQFNCLIGGRGTGKSTILEYLRWGVCDQPFAVSDDEDLPNYQKKRMSLIENTLIPFESVVTVDFTVNGAKHTVRRNARTKELLLRIGEAEFKPCTEDDVRGLITVQAYSQKQLSAVGVRDDELLRFVLAPLSKEIAEFGTKVDGLKSEIRTAHGQLQQKRKLQREIEKDELTAQSIQNQLEELRKGLTGLSPDSQNVMSRNATYIKEEQALNTWDREIQQAETKIREANRELAKLPSRVDSFDGFLNQDLIKEVSQHVEALFGDLKQRLSQAASILDATQAGSVPEKIAAIRRTWETKRKSHDAEYDAIKAQLAAQQERVKQIETAEKQLGDINKAVGSNKAKLASLGTPETQYEAAHKTWASLYKQRADLIEDRCKALTDLSGGIIRATLQRGAGTESIRGKLTDEITGTRIRSRKVEDLCDQVAEANDSVAEWLRILKELEALALLEPVDGKMLKLPDTPSLSRAGFTRDELEKIANLLTVDGWLALSLLELGDTPRFEYKLGDADYIAFADASAGQQATALLRVLLNQIGPPLIIDQPEDDLDNPVILDIVRQLWGAKQRRQIIFSSHNANVVVNGDADLVICCGHRKAGDQTKGAIKMEGAIDVDKINKEITAVMEGGKEAFKLRKDKYGF